MRRILFLLIPLALIVLSSYVLKPQNERFIKVKDQNLIMPDGSKFFIRGINLGNWLNPEGYMFFFKDVNSYRLINDAFCEMVGPDFTNWFWEEFRNNYITHEDIKYIKQTGMNSVRVPFHYKLFTDDNYMGKNSVNNYFRNKDKHNKFFRVPYYQ